MTSADAESIREAAFEAYAQGLCVVPPREDGTKRPKGSWLQHQKTRPSEQRMTLWYGPSSGVGLVCGAISGNLEMFEFENISIYESYRKAALATGLGDLVEQIESGYLEETPGKDSPGFHWFFRVSTSSRNSKLARRLNHSTGEIEVLIETRGEGGYAITAPSGGGVHPSGRPYRLIRGGFSTIETISAEDHANLWELARSFDEIPTHQDSKPASTDLTGERPGDHFNATTTWEQILEPHNWTKVYSRAEVTHWRRPGKDVGTSATTNYKDSDLLLVFSSSTIFESERGYSKFAAYTILDHEGDFHRAAKALSGQSLGSHDNGHRIIEGSLRLNSAHLAKPVQKWPEPLAAEAFHGRAGEIVHLAAPLTEADPVALLLSFLSAFGNAAGRNTLAFAEEAPHAGNINVVLVGDTAKGRKGSSWGQMRRPLQEIDPEWSANIASGMSSGEGLIHHTRDRVEKEIENKAGELVIVVIDQGVEDKRLMIVESEFSAALKMMARAGNTLSPVVRQAWDGMTLRILTKNSPAKSTNAHISVLGHITTGELKKYLNDTEAANGLANRFLWLMVRRAQVLPEGGGSPSYGTLIPELRDTLEWAQTPRILRRDDEAKKAWADIYEELSEGLPGLIGAVIARAEAQVLRLSVIYAILDTSEMITLPHLRAALAIWNYAEASARYIFSDATGDPIADQILEALSGTPNGMSRTVIGSLFSRHVTSSNIDRALSLLKDLGLLRYEKRETGGRPSEVWTRK